MSSTPSQSPEASIAILLVNPDTQLGDAFAGAVAHAHLHCDISRANELDEAIELLAVQTPDVCIVSDIDGNLTSEILDAVKETGIRTPIVTLQNNKNDIAEEKLRDLYGKGLVSAVTWRDDTDNSLLQFILRYALDHKSTQAAMRISRNNMVQELLDLRDARERAEEHNAQYIEMAENLAIAQEELKTAHDEVIANKEILEQLNVEKDKFFSIIAHDLRSPFTALLGFAGLMQQTARTLSPDEVEEYANEISNAGNRIFNLLENLLEWSRLQMGRVACNPEAMSLKDIALKNVALLGHVASEKQITLHSDIGDIQAWADPNMVDAVIRNLVNNAIKFTPTGGRIDINAFINNDHVRVEVRDNGVGIPPDRVGKLFSMSESSSTQGTSGEPGTGLGLLMCQDMVIKNHGTIHAESTPGEGSTFVFTLPIESPATAQTAASA